ncbi:MULTISPECIES: phosphoheptose isomerase [Actinomadura]|uniref:Phosphoheptose isomerase n=1 Tax=Actinomadura litoris TaxID=2678616 RepID=A0A7K1L0E1_9ACTN|nr:MULTISPECIES: phosphoheptose isomerase [Actinomadura]MBT2211722.1 phosphoheptose isomerase [Actinomadura sp. NEAU-AAG7]MUN37783.1 phosphoheptose isomerase [Actinomadura litoris]
MAGFDVLTRGDVLDTALRAREHLVSGGVPGALAAKDPRLWGHSAADHGRLGWLDLPFASRGLLSQVDALVAEARYSGLDHIVLIGVGAESLAAQAVMEAQGRAGADRPTGELTVLDGSDTAPLAFALERLDRTLVVLASKVGVSLEGDAYRRIFAGAFRERGLSEREIAGRFLVVTDHGSPLHDFARQCGYRLGLTDPYLPGHFGALSAYGLVPAVLAGADARRLLEDAAALAPSLSKDDDNPGLLLGAILGGCAQQGTGGVARDKVMLREPGGQGALSAWISQLLAVGTGKQGGGLLAVEPPGARGAFPDVHGVALNPPSPGKEEADTSVLAPLGAQFLLWEYATAVAGWLLGVNPFEPGGTSVQEAEDDAATLLRAAGRGPLPDEPPVYVEDGIEVHADFPWPPGADLRTVLGGLTAAVPADGYLSVVTYLSGDFSGRYLAPSFARASGRPVVYGPGPAYPHATGPIHKEGPGNGAFLVITGDPAPGDALAAHPVPGRPYGLAKLRLARALAEVRSLRARGLPTLRMHLRDPVEGAGLLTEAVRAVAGAGRGR